MTSTINVLRNLMGVRPSHSDNHRAIDTGIASASRFGPPASQEITTQGISFSRSVLAGLMTREDAVAAFRARIPADCSAWEDRTPADTVAYYAAGNVSTYDSMLAYSLGKLPPDLVEARLANASMVEEALAHLFYGIVRPAQPQVLGPRDVAVVDDLMAHRSSDTTPSLPQSAAGAARASASGGARPANLTSGPLAFASGFGVASPARQHLDWCIERAQGYGEAGDLRGAIGSFLADTTKHAATEHIAANGLMARAILQDARDWPSLKQAMIDFDR